MDIVHFTAGASAEALAGSTGGDRVVELGAASVAELLAEPAVGPAGKARLGSRHAGSSHGFRQACPGQQPDGAGPFRNLQTPQLADLRPARLK
jgi:hypothetical protein